MPFSGKIGDTLRLRDTGARHRCIILTNHNNDGNVVILNFTTAKHFEWSVTFSPRDNRKLFDMESLIMKLLPFIIPMLMFMLVIFLTYMITDHWGEFASAAKALSDAAKALQEVSTASTVTG